MKEYYRKLICELIDKVHSETFLRRIYISLRDYVEEKGGVKRDFVPVEWEYVNVE